MLCKKLLGDSCAFLLQSTFMKYGRILLMMIAATCVFSCRKQDIRKAAIHVPDMKSTACAEIVIKALGKGQGVAAARIEVHLESRTIIVDYDSLKHSLKNLEFTVAKAGFQANEVPAYEDARGSLPPECR